MALTSPVAFAYFRLMRALLLLPFFGFPAALAGATDSSGPKADVLKIAYSLKDGGQYNRAWKGSGVLEEVSFKNERILPTNGGGTYCCGQSRSAHSTFVLPGIAIGYLPLASGITGGFELFE